MNFKNLIKKFFLKKNISLNRLNASEDLKLFINRFKTKYLYTDLIRVGDTNDGGYLIPPVLDKVDYCFSPGVDDKSSFELDLAKRNIKSFLIDASIEKEPLSNEFFDFKKKYLSSRTHDEFITLSDWIKESVGDDIRSGILQMDIEGSEYEVLSFEPINTLNKFAVIVVEFHFLNHLFEDHFLKIVSSIFEKLYVDFSICHAHPNNCGEIISLEGIEIPQTLEVSFIRNDFLKHLNLDGNVNLPHILDSRNVKEKIDINLPISWWKKKF